MARPFRKLLIKFHPDAKNRHEGMRGSDLFIPLNNKLKYLRIDPLRGIPVPKGQIPEKYKNMADATNLFQITVNEAGGLHVIYTVGSNEKEIVALILDFLDNDDFNNIFADVDFGDQSESVGTTDVK